MMPRIPLSSIAWRRGHRFARMYVPPLRTDLSLSLLLPSSPTLVSTNSLISRHNFVALTRSFRPHSFIPSSCPTSTRPQHQHACGRRTPSTCVYPILLFICLTAHLLLLILGLRQILRGENYKATRARPSEHKCGWRGDTGG